MTDRTTLTPSHPGPPDFDTMWARAGELAARGQHTDAALAYVRMAQALLAERGKLPPVELLERIARACSRIGEYGHAIRLLDITRDAASETGTPQGARTARHLGLVAAGVCLQAADLESARRLLARELGADAVDAASFHDALQRWPRSNSALDRFEVALFVGRYWAASGQLRAGRAAFDVAARAVAEQDAAVETFYDTELFALWRAQAAADEGDWQAAAATAAERAKTATDHGRLAMSWHILEARALRQLGKLSHARRRFQEAADALERSDTRTAVQARLGLVSTCLLLNRLKDAEEGLAALEAYMGGAPALTGTVCFLASAIQARRRAVPADLAMPFVPEQALEESGSADGAPPADIDVDPDDRRRSERLADDWNRSANALLVALTRNDPGAARRCCETLERWTEGTDSAWLKGRLPYYAALVHYAEGETARARDAALSAQSHARPASHRLDAWQATLLLSWCHARLRNENDYMQSSAEANAMLDEIAAGLDPEDRPYFLLNKWSARDEFVVTRLAGALTPPRSRAPFAWLRRVLDGWTSRWRVGRAHEAVSTVMGWCVERKLRPGDPRLPSAMVSASTGHQIDAWVAAQLGLLQQAVVPGFGTPAGRALCRKLDRKTALLEWYVSPVATYVFVAARDRLQLVCSVTTRVDLDEAVIAWREALAEHAERVRRKAGERLLAQAAGAVSERGRLLAEKIGLGRAIAMLPPGIERIFLLPHDVLTNLPWAALPVAGERLCENVALQVLPSVAWLDPRALRRAYRTPRVLVTLAGTDFPGREGRYGKLAHAEDECDGVVEALGVTVARALKTGTTGASLLESLRGVEWLHAATHGSFDFEAPFRSRLVMPVKEDDDDLKIDALRGQDLRSLAGVVLSACSVQIAAVMPGQEMVSLPIALLHAGVRGVIAPLWLVEDDVTASFMTDLYREMRHAAPAIALARVQRRWARSEEPARATPERWAGFVYFGN